ncbi:MAG: hypothetical protein KC656_16045 [Myxococcales bacterium]|nr:hypothetical protein [Myxococcales bacterium]MCB9670233.1 hypothetical protein [Alphaproteobacteria bacterium]MCB9694674.1 hypothetical protein [Alphaproteobacteria bacterium]
MLLSLLQAALANTPLVSGAYDVTTVDGRTHVDTGVHVGLDLMGYKPGFGARFDIAHRVAVEGRVVAGVPVAEGLKWTGGGTLGVHLAPLRLELGAGGGLDLRVGVGARLTTTGGGELTGTPWSLGSWLSSTVEVSPDGRWTLFGGAVAQDALEGRPHIEPTAGVRVRLD